jgi:hypothetical protein
MHAPPDPETNRGAAGHGTPNSKPLVSTDIIAKKPADGQASPLKLQAFCLARRFALAAPTAEALVPLVYGEVWR